jgi:DNA-binding Lrp family transcriptional regulator
MLNLKKLDRINVRILSELQCNGRMSINDLAEIVGLSASPCLKRVRQLEAAGYIICYGAQLDLTKLCNPQIVFTQITLASHQTQDFILFESKLKKVDELLEAHIVSGGFDYLLKFMTPGITEYQALMDDLLTQNLGIIKYFSFIVLKSPIVKLGYPLKKLLAV